MGGSVGGFSVSVGLGVGGAVGGGRVGGVVGGGGVIGGGVTSMVGLGRSDGGSEGEFSSDGDGEAGASWQVVVGANGAPQLFPNGV